MATTKHVGTMTFGRCSEHRAGRVVCPRCSELDSGATAVKWGPSRAQRDEMVARESRAHFTSDRHHGRGEFAPRARLSHAACGSVCTYGEW